MKRFVLVLAISASFFLTGCDFGKTKVSVADTCQIFKEAGIEKKFGFTRDELDHLSDKHSRILHNILIWYRINCP